MHNVDIILPCYNPIDGWADRIIEALKAIQEKEPSIQPHVYLVNDGSSKGIKEEDINKLKQSLSSFHYLPYKDNKGKGFALRKGVTQSNHEFCIFTDVDFPYTVESFIAIFHKLLTPETLVAVGNRDESYYNKVPASRVRISKVLRFFIKKLLRLKVTDTQCGLKGFKAEGRKLFLDTTTNRYLFDLEFIQLVSIKMPEALEPVPVTLKPDIEFTSMNFPILMREGVSFLKIFMRNIVKKRK